MNLLKKNLLPVAFASILCLGTVGCGKAEAPVASGASGNTFVKTIEPKDNGEAAEPEETSEEDKDVDASAPEENSAENASKDTPTDADNKASEDEAKEENSLLGHSDGDIYENEYFGFGYELKDATWNYLSQEEILRDTEGAKEWMDNEEISNALDSGKIFTAMNATTLDGRSSVRVTVEKTPPLSRNTTADAYLEKVMDDLPQYMDAWHAENLTMEMKPMNVFGKEQNTLWISCTVEGIPIYETQAVLVQKNYIVTCGTAGTKDPEETAALLEGFYILPEE